MVHVLVRGILFMPGLGTLINMGAIILGGILGLLGGNFLKENIRDTLMKANGLCVLFLGIAGTMSKMLEFTEDGISTYGTIMMIASFAIGSIIGELIDLDGKLELFGEWLKKKTGNAKDPQFVNAFVTASLTVCIGAMAIVGAIQDGLYHDISTLTVKAILDFMIILVMAASLGKGTIFSCIPVGILQGSVTLLSTFLVNVMTDTASMNLSLTGNILIFCVGVNLICPKTFKTANMLPAIVIAVIWALLGW